MGVTRLIRGLEANLAVLSERRAEVQRLEHEAQGLAKQITGAMEARGVTAIVYRDRLYFRPKTEGGTLASFAVAYATDLDHISEDSAENGAPNGEAEIQRAPSSLDLVVIDETT